MAVSKINIAFAVDENYIQAMLVAIISVLKNSRKSDNISFYILCNGVSEKSKNKLLELKTIKDFQIHFFDIDISEFSSFNLLGTHITATAYFRMKLADLLPDVKKIIYLDCDIIVKESLQELFDYDLSGKYIAAVEDIGCTYLRKYHKEILPYDFIYINSGVLVINLEEWRKDNIPEKLYITAKSGINHFQHDQEIINIVCHGKCLLVDLSWNVQDSFYKYDEYIFLTHDNNKYIKKCSKKPKIIHFTEAKKPWNDTSMPAAYEWWYYNKFSPSPLKMNNKQKLKFWLARYDSLFSLRKIRNKFILKILGIKISYSIKK